MKHLQGWIGVAPLVAGLLVGCGSEDYISVHYDPPSGSGGSSAASTGEGGTLTGSGGGGGASDCGSCLPFPLVPWDRLTMFSLAAPGEVRDCPETASLKGFEGVGEPHLAPSACPTCECSPASCALPDNMHVSAVKCVDSDGAMETRSTCPWPGKASVRRTRSRPA